LAIEALTDPSFFSLNVGPESKEKKKCFRSAVYNAKKILSTEYQLIGFSAVCLALGFCVGRSYWNCHQQVACSLVASHSLARSFLHIVRTTAVARLMMAQQLV
jgi:hypothetical protein